MTMRRVWAWMAVNFGKHAGIVGVIGLAITLILGLGITQLEFATGQDSYLNKDEQVYKDSVKYQSLFGGQAMLTLFTMDDGMTVADLFTPENIAHMNEVEDQLHQTDGVVTVITPLTALQFTQNMVTGPPEAPDDVTQSVAGQALLDARDREPDPEAQARAPGGRRHDPRPHRGGHRAAHVRQPRVGRLPAVRQPGGHPQVAAAVLPRRGPRPAHHPPASATPRWRSRARPASGSRTSCRPSRSRTPRPRPPAPRCCSRTSTTTCGAGCSPSAPSPSGSWS